MIGLKPSLAVELEVKDKADEARFRGQKPQQLAARELNLAEVAAAEAALGDDAASPATKVRSMRLTQPGRFIASGFRADHPVAWIVFEERDWRRL